MSHLDTPDVDRQAGPRPALSVLDAAAIVVGIVIGGGIFRSPSNVAWSSGSWQWCLLLWAAGGFISLVGALCYAELACAYPNAGGDYHYLVRSYGSSVGFLFAWARLAVIQTGSIAAQAFVVGDYASNIARLGAHSVSIYAAASVLLLTFLNMLGVREGKRAQSILTSAIVAGLILVAFAGVLRAMGFGTIGPSTSPASVVFKPGLALIFILYTYGGWNEAAYLSAEMHGDRRSILRALLLGIAVVTAVYVLVNAAFAAAMGVGRMAATPTVASDLIGQIFGRGGSILISVIVIVAGLSTINGSIFTGARTTYALGRDHPGLALLGRWHAGGPVHAMIIQGFVALALVTLGAFSRHGFELMVEYTAPVFWTFFLLAGLSLFVLRRKEPDVPRPFRAPLFPLTPILFCLACGYMLYSSVVYAKGGSFLGLAVLLAGIPILLLSRLLSGQLRPDPR